MILPHVANPDRIEFSEGTGKIAVHKRINGDRVGARIEEALRLVGARLFDPFVGIRLDEPAFNELVDEVSNRSRANVADVFKFGADARLRFNVGHGSLPFFPRAPNPIDGITDQNPSRRAVLIHGQAFELDRCINVLPVNF
jgi:hypothetical protein